MPAAIQLEFVSDEPTPESVGAFVGYLSWNGWRTRRHLTRHFGIRERQVRLLAERAGTEVVRGPKGFAHIEHVDADEARHCAEIAISQGKKMIRWGLGIKRRLHQRIG